jgi:hypothetical protein
VDSLGKKLIPTFFLEVKDGQSARKADKLAAIFESMV